MSFWSKFKWKNYVGDALKNEAQVISTEIISAPTETKYLTTSK